MKENAIKPLGLSFHPHVIPTYKVMKTPLWKPIVRSICFELCKYKKSDTDPVLYRYYYSELDTAVNNKLHATKPLIREHPSAYRSVRRDEVVLSRLKLGHSYLTHSYLLKG